MLHVHVRGLREIRESGNRIHDKAVVYIYIYIYTCMDLGVNGEMGVGALIRYFPCVCVELGWSGLGTYTHRYLYGHGHASCKVDARKSTRGNTEGFYFGLSDFCCCWADMAKHIYIYIYMGSKRKEFCWASRGRDLGRKSI